MEQGEIWGNHRILIHGDSYDVLLLSCLPHTIYYIAKLRVAFTSMDKSKCNIETLPENILHITIVTLPILSVVSTSFFTLKVACIIVKCQDWLRWQVPSPGYTDLDFVSLNQDQEASANQFCYLWSERT